MVVSETEEAAPRLVAIKSGWAAHGDGWAVHGATREEALERYREMAALIAEIAKRPFWYERNTSGDVQGLSSAHEGTSNEPT